MAAASPSGRWSCTLDADQAGLHLVEYAVRNDVTRCGAPRIDVCDTIRPPVAYLRAAEYWTGETSMPDDETTDDATEPDHIKELRRRAKATDEVASKNTSLERELAFTKAGFDTDHPLVSSLMASYGGELTKDAVKAHMDTLKVTSLLAAGEGDGGDDGGDDAGDGTDATQTRDRLSTIDGGQTLESVPTDDPARVGLGKAFDLMEAGSSREDASTAFFNEIFGAAVKGDARVLTVNQGGERLDA